MHDAIVISDIHLGAHNCQSNLIYSFMEKIESKEVKTSRLIIAGDLFDSFNSRLNKQEWKILGLFRKLTKDLELIWVKGNHDSYSSASTVAHLIGADFYTNHYIMESGKKKVIILHGDIFDDFLTDHPILTWVSDWIYWLLQKVDRSHYIAKTAKQNSKKYLHCSEVVENQALIYASKIKCDLVCCGHTHLAIEKEAYFNSGSWTEIPSSYLSIENGIIKLCFVNQKS